MTFSGIAFVLLHVTLSMFVQVSTLDAEGGEGSGIGDIIGGGGGSGSGSGSGSGDGMTLYFLNVLTLVNILFRQIRLEIHVFSTFEPVRYTYRSASRTMATHNNQKL